MKIKKSQFCVMMFFIMYSFTLGIGSNNYIKLAGVDGWMSPIIGSLIGFLILLLYLFIFNYKSNLNINKLNEFLFGNIIGKIISLIILIFVIGFCMLNFWNLTNFISSQFLYSTPQMFISLLFIVTILYALSKGIESIFRASLIFFYLVAFLYIVCVIGLAFQFKIANLLPILENGINPVLNASIGHIAYTVLPIFFLLIIPKENIDNKNLNKYVISSYIINSIAIFSVSFAVISVFGIDLSKLYQYPDYHVLKRVFIGGFVDRLEYTLSIHWILIIFESILFSCYYIKTSLKDIFGIKKNIYIYPIIIMILIFSKYIFRNNTLADEWLIKTFPLISFIFLLGIPLILFFRINYKKKIHRVSFN